MTFESATLTLAVHEDSWIRQQIRDLVLHLHAPLETAELLQVGLISLAQCVVHFDWDRDAQPAALEADFVALARQRIRADMLDEVRQMVHLSRLQRRRWTLVKLAREHAQLRLRLQGSPREPTTEELSVLTGLSVTEIEVLRRLAQLGPWEPEQGPHHLMEIRSLRPATDDQLRQARQDTLLVLDRVAPLMLTCPRERLKLLQRHFGLNCMLRGEPLLPPVGQRDSWFSRMARWMAPRGLDRRLGHGPSAPSSPDELWPRRLNLLLQQAPKAATR